MKKVLLALAFLFVPTTVQAGWYEYSPGWYVWGTLESNNGYAYYQTYYCGRCYYVNGGLLPPKATTYTTPDNWKELLVKSLHAKQENEQFRAALAESGLENPNQMGSGYGYGSSGYQTVSQGFSQQGSTGYGVAAIPAQQYAGDLGANLHEFQRGADAWRESGTQIYGMLGDLNAQKLDHDGMVAKIYATGQIQVAAIQALQPPTQTTTQWNNQTSSGTQPQQNQQPNQALQVPQNPVPDTRGVREPVLPGITREVLVTHNCAECHTGATHKGNFDLTALNSLSSTDREKLSSIAHARMSLDEKDKQHMPKDHSSVDIQTNNEISAYIRGY